MGYSKGIKTPPRVSIPCEGRIFSAGMVVKTGPSGTIPVRAEIFLTGRAVKPPLDGV